jgi:adenylate kinase
MCGVGTIPALIVRSDDNLHALTVRLKEYVDKTTPVIEIFLRKEFHVDATRSKKEIHTEIRERFGLV